LQQNETVADGQRRGFIPPAVARLFWKLVNPLTIFFARWWRIWAVVETTGRVSGKRRLVPVANNVRDGALWIVAVHGRGAAYVRNMEANPDVRVRIGSRWFRGRADLLPLDEQHLGKVNAYARAGIPVYGWEPLMVRIALA
jgi:deazaflavin-dependent oxidoreductase (nitroreductase family)